MNNSPMSSSFSTAKPSSSSKSVHVNSKNEDTIDDTITINEKVGLCIVS